jgi:sugar lactone lactonase YvrE
MMRAEQITGPVAHHGEGAVWARAWGGLKWVDMLRGDVLTLRADGSIHRLATGSPVAAMIRPRTTGGYVVVTERRFTLWRNDALEWASEPLWVDNRRFNEGTCDPDGRIVCGSMAYDGSSGVGEVWQLSPNRGLTRLFGGSTISNGAGFTADGARMFYVDTPTRRVDVFDYDGSLHDRRTFVRVPEEHGNPDGLWVDTEDGIWLALYGGSAVHHYDATGTLVDIVELPVTNVTSCTFGGDDFSTLYITTSRESLGPADQPSAGSIFQVGTGVTGTVTRAFAG